MKKTQVIEVAYSPAVDISVIIKNCYQNDKLKSEEIIGFYHGEPNDEDTKIYYGKLKATF